MPVRRIILGDDGHGNRGVFSTLPGIDAFTADPANSKLWSFRSDWARVENLHQAGRRTGLTAAPGSYAQNLTMFPPLDYVPFVTVRWEYAAGILQDDPWSKGNYVEQSYFSTYNCWVYTDRFYVGFPIGSSQAPASPLSPTSMIYFVWKLEVGRP
jgi:hypothetical protein